MAAFRGMRSASLRGNDHDGVERVAVDLDFTEDFFLDLVQRLRAEGVRCAITGGLACIEFGVVEHTLDCDLLADPAFSETLLQVLDSTVLHGIRCRFRGTMTAPLDARWLLGGWTSHFEWPRGASTAYLDVFGAPPRVRYPWPGAEPSPYAGRALVAAMKRTQRMKDWSQATALGLQLLDAGDARGWLHLFDADALRGALDHHSPDASMVTLRPVLALAMRDDILLERAIQTEIDFWSRLDRFRLGVYRRAASAYAARIRADERREAASLLEQHALRLTHATACLPTDPLSDYGHRRLVEEARQAAGLGLDPSLLDLLPRVGRDFDYGSDDGWTK